MSLASVLMGLVHVSGRWDENLYLCSDSAVVTLLAITLLGALLWSSGLFGRASARCHACSRLMLYFLICFEMLIVTKLLLITPMQMLYY